MKYLFIFLLMVSCTPLEIITGTVVQVTDGDTFTLLTTENKQEQIRLADIDAPEKGQDFSGTSRLYLGELLAGKTIQVEYKSKDQSGHILGTVFVDGKNINEEMVKEGLAWEFHTNKKARIKELQLEAQRRKLNIFSLPNPINPYDYRQGKR